MAFPDGWGRRCALVIQAGQVSDNEVNFPLLVTEDTLPSEIFDADGSYPALNGGGDVRFSSDEAGNTQLACEIESFITDNDPANGKAALWVRVPSLSGSTNTTIYIWYNKSGESQPAEDNAYGKENVWDSNFMMVQHMNQTPDGAADEIVDSTSNDNDGTTSGMDSADQVAGQIDGSLDFDGGDDYVVVPTSVSLDTLDDATFSAWVKSDNVALANQILFNPGASATDRFQLKFTTDYLRLYNDIDDIGTGVNSASFLSSDTWYYITLTVSGTTWKVYANTAEKISHDFGKDLFDLNDGFHINIGINEWGSAPWTQAFSGLIDEVRISKVARSAGWIATEYNNQFSPGTFLIEGTPETPGAGVTLIVASLNVSGTLDGVNLTQKHNLVIQELSGAGTLENIELTQKHILVLQDLSSLGVLDNIVLEISTLLIVADLVSDGLLDNISLTQKHNIIVQELLSSGALDDLALTQKHVLSISEVMSSGQIDGVALTQKHLLIIDGLISSGIIDNINFDVAAGLIYITLTQTTEYDITLTQSTEYDITLTQAGGGIQ